MNPYALVWTRTEYNIIIFLWLQFSDYFLINCNRTTGNSNSGKKALLLLIIANTSHSYIFTLKTYRKRKKTQNAREITRTCACRPFAVGFLFSSSLTYIFARSPLAMNVFFVVVCAALLTYTIEITHSIKQIDSNILNRYLSLSRSHHTLTLYDYYYFFLSVQ